MHAHVWVHAPKCLQHLDILFGLQAGAGAQPPTWGAGTNQCCFPESESMNPCKMASESQPGIISSDSAAGLNACSQRGRVKGRAIHLPTSTFTWNMTLSSNHKSTVCLFLKILQEGE